MRSSAVTKPAKTANMISAAAVTTAGRAPVRSATSANARAPLVNPASRAMSSSRLSS
ncbi:hypothetical protein [Streptomyces niveus]|uniref:hypothetical protein n=1 Tax=Streptomyces niveus TaxID=193462 RepID=UPI0036853D8D